MGRFFPLINVYLIDWIFVNILSNSVVSLFWTRYRIKWRSRNELGELFDACDVEMFGCYLSNYISSIRAKYCAFHMIDTRDGDDDNSQQKMAAKKKVNAKITRESTKLRN